MRIAMSSKLCWLMVSGRLINSFPISALLVMANHETPLNNTFE